MKQSLVQAIRSRRKRHAVPVDRGNGKEDNLLKGRKKSQKTPVEGMLSGRKGLGRKERKEEVPLAVEGTLQAQ